MTFAELLDWAAATAISAGAVSLGTLIRYSHAARRAGTKIDWGRLFRYEIWTILGLTVIAVPVSQYLQATFEVEHGITAATCVSLGYLGTRVFDFFSKWMEAAGEKDDPKGG